MRQNLGQLFREPEPERNVALKVPDSGPNHKCQSGLQAAVGSTQDSGKKG